MHSPQPRFGRHNILLFFLLLLFCMTAGPPRPWARSQAAAQCAILITPLMLPGGSVGVPYSQNLNAIGGSGRLSFALIANSLPPGLTLSPASGLISGTPNTTGTYSFLIRATEANDCSATRAYTITVDCGRITLDPTRLPGALSSTAYTQILSASGGREPYNYSILQGALPPGLSLAPNGNLTGTPTAAGDFSFTVRATAANGCVGERALSIIIAVNTVVSVSAASFAAGGPLATESIAAAFGSDLAAGTQVASRLPLPTELAGITLRVKDSAGANASPRSFSSRRPRSISKSRPAAPSAWEA